MTIKTVCKLSLKREEEYISYTNYEIYPLASMFANSDDDALISYIKEILNKYIEIQECAIMEASLEYGDTLRFYRVKGRNITFNHDVVEDYIVINVPFIGC